MEAIVRAVDVGFGQTNFITGVGGFGGGDIRCAGMASLSYTCRRNPATRPAADRRKTIPVPVYSLICEVGDGGAACPGLRPRF
jgi:plasmid segregation protein ParM